MPDLFSYFPHTDWLLRPVRQKKACKIHLPFSQGRRWDVNCPGKIVIGNFLKIKIPLAISKNKGSCMKNLLFVVVAIHHDIMIAVKTAVYFAVRNIAFIYHKHQIAILIQCRFHYFYRCFRHQFYFFTTKTMLFYIVSFIIVQNLSPIAWN